jgi:hypothetical protein
MNTAKEITAHFVEFIIWKDFGQNPFIPWFDVIDGKEIRYYTDEVNTKKYTLEEVYQYWLNNIKK